jgi:hypothetical protein
MTGVSRRNFNMFRKLCGDNSLQNVVIVTNMWGEVSPWIGDEREAELMSEDIFFKPVLDKGAQMARHLDTAPSSVAIIRIILNNHPLPLRIQEELVDEHMDISETGAGEELNQAINAQIRRLLEEVRSLREEMEQSRRDRDEETRRELEFEIKKLHKEAERSQNDAKRLESDYKKEKERLEDRIMQVEFEARQEADRIAAHYQQQIDELRSALQSNAEASEREKAQIVKQINQLSRGGARALAVGPARGGFFSRLAAVMRVF